MLDYYNHKNIVLHQQRSIYFFIPKVACTSLKTFCAKLIFPYRQIDTEHVESIHHSVDFPYVKRSELSQFNEYFKFVFVRNPWDRLVSCYKSKIKEKDYNGFNFKDGVASHLLKYKELFYGGMPFDEFVDTVCIIPDNYADPHFQSQFVDIVNENKQIFVEFVGKFETIDSDFEYVCDRIGIDNSKLSHKNKTRHKHYTDYYTSSLRGKVYDRYKEDIALLNYTW